MERSRKLGATRKGSEITGHRRVRRPALYTVLPAFATEVHGITKQKSKRETKERRGEKKGVESPTAPTAEG